MQRAEVILEIYGQGGKERRGNGSDYWANAGAFTAVYCRHDITLRFGHASSHRRRCGTHP